METVRHNSGALNCYVVLSTHGADHYLQYTLGSMVKALGPERVKILSSIGHDFPGCETIHIPDGTGQKMVYKYFDSEASRSSPAPEFHSLGWLRWGALMDTMKSRRESHAISSDPDEILFVDPSTTAHVSLGSSVMTRSSPFPNLGCWTPSLSVLSVELIELFCHEYLIGDGKEQHDMELWSRIASTQENGIVDGAIPKEGVAFDHNLNTIDGWYSEDGVTKTIQVTNGICCARHVSCGDVKLVNAHCWNKDIPTIQRLSGLL